jgi:hypothetical protein
MCDIRPRFRPGPFLIDRLSIVMPGLDPGIHDLLFEDKDVDGRDKPGHDDGWDVRATIAPRSCFLQIASQLM